MKFWAIAALAAVLTPAGNASAAIINVKLNGTTQDNKTFGGSFDFDDQGKGFSQYSNVKVLSSGFTFDTIQTTFTVPGTSTFGILFTEANSGGAGFQLRFDALSDGFTLRAITGNQVTFGGTTYPPSGVFVPIASGTLTTSVVSSVPEPATWAIMIAGFGLVGVAMRRRAKRSCRNSSYRGKAIAAV